MKKIISVLLAAVMLVSAAAFFSVSAETATETFDFVSSFDGTKATYGRFTIYTAATDNAWTALASKSAINSDGTATGFSGEYGTGSKPVFKSGSGEVCVYSAGSQNIIVTIGFIAPYDGKYTLTLNAHTWEYEPNPEIGIAVDKTTNNGGDFDWQGQNGYRPVQNSGSDLTREFDLKANQPVYLSFLRTRYVTINKLSFSRTYEKGQETPPAPMPVNFDEVYDAKDGFGINAKYGQFQLMYSNAHSDFNAEYSSMKNLSDTYTTVYKGEGVSPWNFKTVNGEMCVCSIDYTSIVKFTAPQKGNYTMKLKVHGWNSAQGVISTVGVRTNGEKIWNDDYRPTSTAAATAKEAVYNWDLGKGDEVYVFFSYATYECTIDTLTFGYVKNPGTSDVMPAIIAVLAVSSLGAVVVFKKRH